MPQMKHHNEGMSQFLRLAGSVFPRSLPVALGAMFLSICCLFVRRGAYGADTWWAAAIEHPFAAQVFGIVLGFITANRLTLAMSRWWEGMSAVSQMTSKWGDAFLQTMAFLSTDTRKLEKELSTLDLETEEGRAKEVKVRGTLQQNATFKA